jgi:DNA-binding GntR family transcriptional regulator
LRDLIIEGELPPGTRLNERTLCDRLGVSRTPLREAFRLLAADGLITIRPNHGAQVVVLSRNDIRECFEVLAGLEAMSGELACHHVSDREVAEITALTFEMQACHARLDLPAYHRINREIHNRISAAAGNQLLSQVFQSLNSRVQNLRFRSNYDHDKWTSAMNDHIDIAHALSKRDGAGLATILRAHVRRKGEVVLEGLAGLAAEPAQMA